MFVVNIEAWVDTDEAKIQKKPAAVGTTSLKRKNAQMENDAVKKKPATALKRPAASQYQYQRPATLKDKGLRDKDQIPTWKVHNHEHGALTQTPTTLVLFGHNLRENLQDSI